MDQQWHFYVERRARSCGEFTAPLPPRSPAIPRIVLRATCSGSFSLSLYGVHKIHSVYIYLLYFCVHVPPSLSSLSSVSDFIRCGFAGEPRPIHVVPSPIGFGGFTTTTTGDAGSDGGRSGGGGGGMARTKEEWVEVLTGVLSRVYTDSLQCRPRVSLQRCSCNTRPEKTAVQPRLSFQSGREGGGRIATAVCECTVVVLCSDVFMCSVCVCNTSWRRGVAWEQKQQGGKWSGQAWWQIRRSNEARATVFFRMGSGWVDVEGDDVVVVEVQQRAPLSPACARGEEPALTAGDKQARAQYDIRRTILHVITMRSTYMCTYDTCNKQRQYRLGTKIPTKIRLPGPPAPSHY